MFLLSLGKQEIKRVATGSITVGFSSIEIAKKVFVTLDNVFHVYLMSGLKKCAKKKDFDGVFFKIQFVLFEMHMEVLGPRDVQGL